jgi:hypothetical protein
LRPKSIAPTRDKLARRAKSTSLHDGARNDASAALEISKARNPHERSEMRENEKSDDPDVATLLRPSIAE